MSETTMPVAEAVGVGLSDEQNTYELAFHVLPTVTEGEVSSIFTNIKESLVKTGATLGSEEMPQRTDLAYEVVKHLEGKNRKFKSAYFGWVRFTGAASSVVEILAMMEAQNSILRHLLIKLTKQEALEPFNYHEAMKAAGTIVTEYDLDDADEESIDENDDVVEADEVTEDVSEEEKA